VRIGWVGTHVGKDPECIALRGDRRASGRTERPELGVDVAGTIGVVRAHQVDVRFAIAATRIDVLGHVPAAKAKVGRLVGTWRRCAINAQQGAQPPDRRARIDLELAHGSRRVLPRRRGSLRRAEGRMREQQAEHA
jgi:hypothetical protein